MGKLAVLGVLWAWSLAGQTITQPSSCLTKVGAIAYPPYEWGEESAGSVTVLVQVGSNGSAEILSINGSEVGFEREVQKSIAASAFEGRCAGQKLILSYE